MMVENLKKGLGFVILLNDKTGPLNKKRLGTTAVEQINNYWFINYKIILIMKITVCCKCYQTWNVGNLEL